MKKPYKVIWGILTPAPIFIAMLGAAFFILMILHNLPEKGTPNTNFNPTEFIGSLVGFYALILLAVLLGFLVHISYFIHLVRNDNLNKDMKTLWVVLFLIVNVLAMIVYWFLNVWPEPEAKGRRNKG